jgi:hypothetical protein
MLEHLPPGVLDWSDNYLDQSIEDVLTDGEDEKVWLASADMLAREGRSYWVAYLQSFLVRTSEIHTKPHYAFWNRLAFGAYRLSSQDADVRDEITDIAQHLLTTYRDAVSAEGLRRVLDILSDTPSEIS